MPLMNLIVAALVLLTAYMWTAQGFFSAMIHFLCTLVAGAIALTVWEPLVYGVLLDATPTYAWTVGLVVPFLVSLVLLRVATDKLVTKDPKVPGSLDFVGGGVAGAGAGIISAGILVIGIGFMPLGSTFLGHRMMEYDSTGNLVRTNSLWIPVDTLTAKTYEMLSVGAFTPGDSALALRMPGLDEQASLVRATYNDRARAVFTPDAFELTGTYVVEADSLGDLTTDGFVPDPSGSGGKPQDVKRTDGDAPDPDSVIRGYTVKMLSASAEESGLTVVGAGQVRLICRLRDGGAEGFQPIAVASQAVQTDSSTDALAASRFRFDTKDVFIGSVGRTKDPSMSFEFLVPADAEPVDLLVKQVRVPLGDAPAPRTFSVDERDDAIYSLDLIGRSGEGPTGARPAAGAGRPRGSGSEDPVDGGDSRSSAEAGVRVGTDIGGLTISRQNRGGLSLNDDNKIVQGSHSFASDDVTGGKIPTQLKITGFAVPPGVNMVQVEVSLRKRASIAGRATDAAEQLLAPLLKDTRGQLYEAVGYIFQAGSRTDIHYDASQPVRSIGALPSLSASRPNDRLTLLFQVDSDISIDSFTLGGQVEVLSFDPPLYVRR